MPRTTHAMILTILLLVGFAGTASAHTHVEVADGQYELTVGWTSEPPYAGVKNGLDLRVERILEDHSDGDHEGHETEGGHHGDKKKEVVEGLLDNLTVTYEYAGRTFTPPEWRAQWGKPGWYTAEITPTREGEYTVRIVGDIEGNPIDVRVKPHAVEAFESTMFPVEDPATWELEERIADLETQVADLSAKVDALRADAQSEANKDVPVNEQERRTPAPGVLLVPLVAVGAALLLRRR